MYRLTKTQTGALRSKELPASFLLRLLYYIYILVSIGKQRLSYLHKTLIFSVKVNRLCKIGCFLSTHYNMYKKCYGSFTIYLHSNKKKTVIAHRFIIYYIF